MIDINKEMTAIIRKIHEFAARGIDHDQLTLYTGADFRRRLTRHLDARVSHTDPTAMVAKFHGIKIIELEDFEGWRVDKAYTDMVQRMVYSYDLQGEQSW